MKPTEGQGLTLPTVTYRPGILCILPLSPGPEISAHTHMHSENNKCQEKIPPLGSLNRNDAPDVTPRSFHVSHIWEPMCNAARVA